MGRVTTNNTQLAYAPEAPNARGTLPQNPVWTLLEPNDITDIGATITTTESDPISPTRQRRKGAVTDLDSAMGFEHNATYGLSEEFIPTFVFANRTNDDLNVRPSAVMATHFVSAAYPINRLVWSATGPKSLWIAEGFSNEANNGLMVANAAPAAGRINAEKIGSPNTALVVEANPPKGARVRFAGTRAVAHADNAAVVTANGNATITLPAAAITAITAGLTVGQVVAIYENADNFIWGRYRSTTATTLGLDKATITKDGDQVRKAGLPESLTDDVQYDVLYGGFARNVAVSHADYLERSFTIEAVWDNLENDDDGMPTGNDEYEYSLGNYCNSFALNLAGQSLATATVGFIGTDTESPVKAADRKAGANDPFPAPRPNALNTTSDILRLRILEGDLDPAGLTTDFSSATITLNNNVSPEKVLGSLAARYMNFGNFEVDFEGDIIFSDSRVIAAVRGNQTVTMDWILRNNQGTNYGAAVAFDIPSMTLGLGGRTLTRDESVTLSVTSQAFGDPVLGYSLGVSFIPYIPE